MRPQGRIPKDAGFKWDITRNYFNEYDSESEDSDKDEDDDPNMKIIGKLNETQQREENMLQELRQRKYEEELIQVNIDPWNPDHFERLLLSNPNSSYIWIEYVKACHTLALGLEKTRETAQRALSTIDTGEEIERLNIWSCIFILENLCGTQESFQKAMNEALRSHDKYQIYMKILEMFGVSERLTGLDYLVTKINRKFSDSIDAYLLCASVYFKRNKSDQARLILQTALTNLPTKSHVTMICKFALVENSDGSPEEARSLFEHVLTCYPLSIDTWSLYVYMLIKSERFDLARHAFERSTRQQIAPKKMNGLFCKWMMMEAMFGTSEYVNKVEECMKNYFGLISKNKK